jgi:hypothetical protein
MLQPALKQPGNMLIVATATAVSPVKKTVGGACLANQRAELVSGPDHGIGSRIASEWWLMEESSQVECRSEDGIDFTVKYDKLVIATGSQVSCAAALPCC